MIPRSPGSQQLARWQTLLGQSITDPRELLDNRCTQLQRELNCRSFRTLQGPRGSKETENRHPLVIERNATEHPTELRDQLADQRDIAVQRIGLLHQDMAVLAIPVA